MKDSDFLAEMKASEELASRGFTKEPCQKCDGKGYITGFDSFGYAMASKCYICGGQGYHWQGPITK